MSVPPTNRRARATSNPVTRHDDIHLLQSAQHHMIEREPDISAITNKLVDQLTASRDAVLSLYADLQSLFWAHAQEKYLPPAPDSVSTDVRCWPAFFERAITSPATRMKVMSVVFFEHQKNLSIEETASVQTLQKSGGIELWDLYLWLGPKVLGTRHAVRKISASLSARKYVKVPIRTFLEAVWRQILEKRGTGATIPVPDGRDITAVLNKIREENPAWVRRPGKGGKPTGRQGKKRKRGAENEDDDDDDDEDDDEDEDESRDDTTPVENPRGRRTSKRQRSTAGQSLTLTQTIPSAESSAMFFDVETPSALHNSTGDSLRHSQSRSRQRAPAAETENQFVPEGWGGLSDESLLDALGEFVRRVGGGAMAAATEETARFRAGAALAVENYLWSVNKDRSAAEEAEDEEDAATRDERQRQEAVGQAAGEEYGEEDYTDPDGE